MLFVPRSLFSWVCLLLLPQERPRKQKNRGGKSFVVSLGVQGSFSSSHWIRSLWIPGRQETCFGSLAKSWGLLIFRGRFFSRPHFHLFLPISRCFFFSSFLFFFISFYLFSISLPLSLSPPHSLSLSLPLPFWHHLFLAPLSRISLSFPPPPFVVSLPWSSVGRWKRSVILDEKQGAQLPRCTYTRFSSFSVQNAVALCVKGKRSGRKAHPVFDLRRFLPFL